MSYTTTKNWRADEIINIPGHAGYKEMLFRGQTYALSVITTGTTAVGQRVGTIAAQATQFAVFNPVGSGVDLVLLRLRIGIKSGTAPAGSVMHSIYSSIPTLAASGTPVNLLLGSANTSVAKTYTSAAGAALTGGTVPTTLMPSTLSSTASVQATVFPNWGEDWIDGNIIIRPGYGYAPLQPAAGVNFIVIYSLIWEEVPY